MVNCWIKGKTTAAAASDTALVNQIAINAINYHHSHNLFLR